MRTAEEIYESNVQYERYDVNDRLKKSVIEAIITAQKEAIEECAKRAICFLDMDKRSLYMASLDEDSILSLIKELK